MEPNPYESPRVPDALEIHNMDVHSEDANGVPYWSFLDALIFVVWLGVILALLLPAVM
jgi:hypothetical protein